MNKVNRQVSIAFVFLYKALTLTVLFCIIVVQKSYARESITAAADLKGLKTCPIFWFFTLALKNTGAVSFLKNLL